MHAMYRCHAHGLSKDITVEDENGEPWLESPHKVEPKLLQGVLFRVQQTVSR